MLAIVILLQLLLAAEALCRVARGSKPLDCVESQHGNSSKALGTKLADLSRATRKQLELSEEANASEKANTRGHNNYSPQIGFVCLVCRRYLCRLARQLDASSWR